MQTMMASRVSTVRRLQLEHCNKLNVVKSTSAVSICSRKNIKRSLAVSAVAAPSAPFETSEFRSPLEDPAERERLAKEYGFRKIGEPLPDNVTLRQIVDTLPKEVFEINEFKAWKSVVLTVVAVAASIVGIAYSPWYLLPIAWALAGTASTGLFVIGHDCAHKSFLKNKFIEDVVGTIAFMPLIYPYEPWRIKHNEHHAKTNMLVYDTAWHPVMPEEYKELPPLGKVGLQIGMGPLRFLASIGHWLVYHFDLKKYRANEQNRVKISLAAVYAFIGIALPLITYFTGFEGLIKFWLMPWLGYHFWMSTFTMVHHTAPHIPFKAQENWNAAQAQLGGTVHCDYPAWVEVLCHDINVHVPHHLSQRIPAYNLRKATDSLRENWGKYMNEATWNWRLMKTIFTECHFFDSEKNYVSFDTLEKAPMIGALRKTMPPI